MRSSTGAMRYGYFVVLGVIGLIVVALYAGFNRNRWL